jgi:uncharacterized protein YodC (DUF2158 family)
MNPTPEQLEKLKNKTLVEISHIFKIDTSVISKLFREYGIKKPELRGLARKKPMPPKEDLENHKAKTLLEISQIYNTDPTTIGRWLKRYGIERDSLQGRHLKVDKLIPAKEILETYSDKTYLQIAEIYGVNHMEVCHWFKHHGMSRRPERSKEHILSTKENFVDNEKIKLSLINKILTASDDYILAIHTLLEGKK